MLMRKFFSIILMLIIAIPGAAKAQDDDVDAGDPLASLKSASPEISAAMEEERAARADVWAARGAYFPQLRVEAQGGRIEENLTINGIGSTGDLRRDPRSVALIAEQALFTSGRIEGEVGAAKARYKAAQSQSAATRQETFFSGVVAISDIVRDREILRERRLNETTLRERLAESEKRRSAGRATITDVEQSRARSSQASAERISAEAALMRSEAAYERIFGVRAPADISLPAAPDVEFDDVQDALNAAITANPRLAAQRNALRSAAAAVRAARGAALPQVSLSAQYAELDDERFGPELGQAEQTAVFLRARWDFFSGGSNFANMRASKRRREAERQRVVAAEREIRALTIDSWNDILAAEAALVARSAAASAARVARNGVAREFENGRRTRLDVLDADRELSDAEVALTTARRNLLVAQYALLVATGQLEL